MQHVDPNTYPATASYLDSFGGNLDAFGECAGRPDLYADILELYPDLLDARSLSTDLRARLQEPWLKRKWMPSVLGVSLNLMVRDTKMADEAAFLRWSFERAGGIYRKPLYRALMFVISPMLAVMGASKRWSAFNQGSTLESRGTPDGATLDLRYPDGVYPHLHLLQLQEAFRAGVSAAGAKSVNIRLSETEAGHAQYRLRWR